MELVIYSKIYGSHVVYYDDIDHELVSGYHWMISKGKKGVFYARGYIGKKSGGNGVHDKARMHRLIMNCPEDLQIDHIDGNGLNNQRVNLRVAKNAQNCRNQRAHSDSLTGYKGITFVKKKKLYFARIRVNNKLISLGRSKDLKKAVIRYNEAATKYFGEFAFLNKIPNE
jgi:hypothetical protein